MFTENQVRQFYVLGADKAIEAYAKDPETPNTDAPTNASDTGAMQLVTGDNEAYFLYKGPSADGLQRTDLIKKCNVMDVRITDARDMLHPMRKLEVALDSNVSSSPVVGQDYILNVEIKGYITNGTNSTKVKFGVAKAATGDTASNLYKKLAINLAKNFAREPWPLVKVMVKISTSYVEVLPSYTTSSSALSGSASCIAIEEVEQPWRRGAAKQEFVDFNVYPSTIDTGSAEGAWGTVNDATPAKEDLSAGTNAFPNSKAVADMEYFFHKERGDVYGYAGFPYNFDTEYQVVPTNTDGYSIVDIHYYFEGNSHNVGRSEKTLTIVGAADDIEDLIGTPYVPASGSGQDAVPAVDATGLFAFLEGSNAEIKFSDSWGS